MPQTTCAVLFAHLVRKGETGRAGELIDRLAPAALAALMCRLDDPALRGLATHLCEPARAATMRALPFAALLGLTRVAAITDARTVLATVAPARSARLLMALPEGRRAALVPAEARRPVPSPALRMHRLFTAPAGAS